MGGLGFRGGANTHSPLCEAETVLVIPFLLPRLTQARENAQWGRGEADLEMRVEVLERFCFLEIQMEKKTFSWVSESNPVKGRTLEPRSGFEIAANTPRKAEQKSGKTHDCPANSAFTRPGSVHLLTVYVSWPVSFIV